MNLTDLRIFACAARRPSLGAAALELHLTPSAVSKALRRLEQSLGTPLFDRSAKLLVLNESGRRLLARAQTLLALAEGARADIMGGRSAVQCRLGGPSVLLWRHGARVAQALRAYPEASLRLQALFEDDALAALASADLHAAVVTGAAIEGRARDWPAGWEATPLGALEVLLVAHHAHPLAGRGPVAPEALRGHDFACPTRSLFCGEARGARSDGWRDAALPRTIRYWTDDLQLLLGFVGSGAALAFLPEYALDDPALRRIEVRGGHAECREQVWLVWDRAMAGDWLAAVARALAAPSSMPPPAGAPP